MNKSLAAVFLAGGVKAIQPKLFKAASLKNRNGDRKRVQMDPLTRSVHLAGLPTARRGVVPESQLRLNQTATVESSS